MACRGIFVPKKQKLAPKRGGYTKMYTCHLIGAYFGLKGTF